MSLATAPYDGYDQPPTRSPGRRGKGAAARTLVRRILTAAVVGALLVVLPSMAAPTVLALMAGTRPGNGLQPLEGLDLLIAAVGGVLGALVGVAILLGGRWALTHIGGIRRGR